MADSDRNSERDRQQRKLLSINLGTSIVLAGGVALYATNGFDVGLLPSTIADIRVAGCTPG